MHRILGMTLLLLALFSASCSSHSARIGDSMKEATIFSAVQKHDAMKVKKPWI